MFVKGRLCLGIVLLAALAGMPVRAQLPPIPGIRAEDHRGIVDLQQAPWNAIVRVQTSIGTRCTGAVIGATTVLTAAHCLYNPRTRALLQPGSLHVLIGADRGRYRQHLLVRRYRTGARYDGTAVDHDPLADWARLDLAQPVLSDIVPLALATEPSPAGTPIMLPGYSQDRAEILLADRSCRIFGLAAVPGATLLAHDCSATHGTSGGPLLVETGGLWRIAGINLGFGRQAGVALPVSQFRAELAAP